MKVTVHWSQACRCQRNSPSRRQLPAAVAQSQGNGSVRDWSAAADKRYWATVADKVESLKSQLRSFKQTSGSRADSYQNGMSGNAGDPRPFPSSPEHIIWIGMSAWEVIVRSHFILQRESFDEMYSTCEAYTNMHALSRIAVFLANERIVTPDEVVTMFWGIFRGDEIVPEYNATREADRRQKLNEPEREGLKSAMAFQCLVGCLQMTDTRRLQIIAQSVLKSNTLDVSQDKECEDLQLLLKRKA